MGTFFLRVNASTEVVGWQRTHDSVAPPAPSGLSHVVIDETLAEVQAYLQNPAHPDNGPPRWEWNGSNVVDTPDPRIRVRVTQTPNPGVTGVALEVKLEVIDGSDQVRTGVNRTDTVSYLNQNGLRRRASVSVAAGVATRTFTPSESGELRLVSDRDNVRFVGDNPVVIDEAW